MRTPKFLFQPEKIGSIFLLMTAFYTFFLLPTPIEEPSAEKLSLYTNLSLCTQYGRFDIDLETATKPVAPLLETKWQNQMNITASAAAQVFFNQGLFNLYGFNHAEAERAFKEGIRLDEDCAMCYWGASLALGPNINVPMPENQIKDAYLYSQKAMEKSTKVSPKEQALIQALSKRYLENPPEDRVPLDQAYSDEMRYVTNRYREDLDIAALYAESLMDLMPWNYWEADQSPKPATREIQNILDYILEKDENHPGANHYYIHLTEAVHPQLAVKSADKLTELAYPSGHLVHMPSHIYIRVGRYNDAAVANEVAIKIDEDYIEKCKAQGVYPALYYPHNIHFLWFSASMEGRYEKALAAARKLDKKVPYAMAAQVPMIERFKSIPIFTLVRFGKWDAILKEPKPDDHFVYSQTMWHFARGLAYTKKGKVRKAKKELEKVQAGRDNEALQAVDNPQFPTIGITEIAFNILSAEIAGQKGNANKKVAFMEKAVAAQDNLIYMEPPFFYFPARQALGTALLEANQLDKAEAIFKEDLKAFPANGWSLFGLHQSLIKQQKTAEAKEIHQAFKKAWQRSDVKLKSAVI